MLVDVRSLAPSVEELLAGADRREPFVNPDGRSAATFERVWIDGVAHVVKYLHLDCDFTMRVSGDVDCRTVRAWAAGLLDSAPHLIDHAVVGAALGHGRKAGAPPCSCGTCPPTSSRSQTRTFPPTSTSAYSTTWPGSPRPRGGGATAPCPARGCCPTRPGGAWFSRAAIDGERALGWPEAVPRIADGGWHRFGERAPAAVVEVIDAMRDDVTPLADALRDTPSCFLHGDVKASNTGTLPDGRTVLIDWAYVGEGPACHELAWHLALDRSWLPATKEATVEAFRSALGRHGVDTAGWWERQLGLCLLGAVVQSGWEKALGDDDELAWWCDAAAAGAAWL